ncbi:hypothetical protein [Parasitella parasitica]|uniref:Charged multivesicular body protein 7 n=1 Tax=Parasitella parasitica TaxID=35722 RepID=A0A0B7NBS5_9FUNG|nr:hypothetical protein [Parasitella parasitica]
MNSNSITERISRLQDYLASQYVDFDRKKTTDRLLSLYSDFSKLKILNNYGYDANVNYWRAVILDCNLHGYLTSKYYGCFIDKNELGDLFHRPGKGKPLSLDYVLQDMIEKTYDLMTQKEYEKQYPIQAHSPSSSTLTWLQWIYYIPYRWIIPETPSHSYVVLPTVQEYTKMITQKHYSKPLCSSLDNLFTFLEFRDEYSTILCHQETIVRLSDVDLWIILRYLHHCYGVAIADTSQAFGAASTVIKFPDRNQAVKVAADITDNDKAIVNLKTACSALHQQVEGLQAKSEEFLRLTREHNAKNQKPQAVYMLRKKRHIEEILERRFKTLETMETILLKIETSQNDLQVVEAFNMGANTLRSLLSGKDMVAETMDKLKDTLEDQHAIEQAMAVGNEEISNQAAGITNEDLENELDAIITADSTPSTKEAVSLTQPINTESELLRLQNVLSSLSHPSNRIKMKELA